jgi:hypothetical protein
MSSVGKANVTHSSKNPEKPSTKVGDKSVKDKSLYMPPPTIVTVRSGQRPTQFWELTDLQTKAANDYIATQNTMIRLTRRGTVAYNTLGTINSGMIASVDVASLMGTRWLTNIVIDVFLSVKFLEFRHSAPHETYRPSTLLPSRFSYLILKEKHTWDRVADMTAQLSALYLENDIIFPYNVPGHYISCIISKFQRSIFIIDGYPNRPHRDLFEPIKVWFTQEHISRAIEPPDYNDQDFPWRFLSGNSLPRNRPFQTDDTSCGPLTAFTLLHYMLHGRLPVAAETFTQRDVPNLRQYMAYSILKVFQEPEDTLQSYAEDINGRRLTERELEENLGWMGYVAEQRQRVIQMFSQEEEKTTTGATSASTSMHNDSSSSSTGSFTLKILIQLLSS